jgi:hypothetical protein
MEVLGCPLRYALYERRRPNRYGAAYRRRKYVSGAKRMSETYPVATRVGFS